MIRWYNKKRRDDVVIAMSLMFTIALDYVDSRESCGIADILHHSQDSVVIIGTWETNIQNQREITYKLIRVRLLINCWPSIILEDHINKSLNKNVYYGFICSTVWGVVFESY